MTFSCWALAVEQSITYFLWLLVSRRYEVTSTNPVSFIWAFQKRSSETPTERSSALDSQNIDLREDFARIYLIDVTNPLVGGAQKCNVCPKGASQDGLVSAAKLRRDVFY